MPALVLPEVVAASPLRPCLRYASCTCWRLGSCSGQEARATAREGIRLVCEERSNRRWALEKGRRRRVDTEGAVEVGPIGPVSPSRLQKGEADPRSPSSAPRTENSAHYLLYFTLFLPPFANASVTLSGHTMFALASLLALASSAAALQVTQPSNSSGWTTSGPNTVTWSSVNTDKSNFTIVLNNQVSYAS